jgi:Zn-dependent protease
LDGITLQIIEVIVIGVPILLAITLHEAAHGFVALRFGDDTALRMGRVTLNPFKHIDPVGTILIPGLLLLTHAPFLFGYAKPVPVNFARLRNPKRDMIFVAAAGPATNIFLALVSAMLLKLMLVGFVPSSFELETPSVLIQAILAGLQYSVFINVLLAVFNMLPIPPLDGGRVLVGLLPYRMAIHVANLERYGMFIILAIIFIIPILTQTMGYQINLFSMLLLPIIKAIEAFIFGIFGL